MYGDAVIKRHHSKVSVTEFRNPSPKPMPVVFLRFGFDRIPNDILAPFLFQVRALPQHLVLEITRVLVSRHRTECIAPGGVTAIPPVMNSLTAQADEIQRNSLLLA